MNPPPRDTQEKRKGAVQCTHDLKILKVGPNDFKYLRDPGQTIFNIQPLDLPLEEYS